MVTFLRAAVTMRLHFCVQLSRGVYIFVCSCHEAFTFLCAAVTRRLHFCVHLSRGVYIFVCSCHEAFTFFCAAVTRRLRFCVQLSRGAYILCTLYSCHEAGAVSLVHASQHQLLISAGKKGELFSSSLSIKPRTYSYSRQRSYTWTTVERLDS